MAAWAQVNAGEQKPEASADVHRFTPHALQYRPILFLERVATPAFDARLL